jgi:hypothetical protein
MNLDSGLLPVTLIVDHQAKTDSKNNLFFNASYSYDFCDDLMIY